MIQNYPPLAFSNCSGEKCSHQEKWPVDSVPRNFDCPNCGGRNILEREPEISYSPGMTTPVKVVGFVPSADIWTDN